MEKLEASTGIYLDTRYKKQDGTYPVKLRITFKRESRLHNTVYSFTKSDYAKIIGSKPRGQFKDLKLELVALEKKASKVIKNLPTFSFDAFKKKFLNKPGEFSLVFPAFKQHINILTNENKLNTAVTYRSAFQSLKKYYPFDKLRFQDITPGFLQKYENWMLTENKSLTTISMYVRCLKHLYNTAINRGDARKEDYPFKRDKYQIPQPRNIKKALLLSDIAKIFRYEPENDTPEHFYRDLWLFSYLCSGMNMKDICILKYNHIHGDFIHYRRAKTESRNRNSKPIEVYLTDKAREIIHLWGNQQVSPDNYVFPILSEGLTANQIQQGIKQVTKQTNKYIKRIAAKVGINENISTYTARHSFATILKRSGASTEFISEQLGHTTVKTTEGYLDSFEDEKKKEMARELTKFE